MSKVKKRKRPTGNTLSPCGCWLLVMVVNLTIGAVCFDYVLQCTIDKDVHWAADAVAGLFLGELTIPLAVVCWVIKLAGVDTPFFAV